MSEILITPESKEAQIKKLYNAFKKGLKISTAYASNRMNIYSFHRRMTDLRRKYKIQIEKMKVVENGVMFYRYYFSEETIRELNND